MDDEALWKKRFHIFMGARLFGLAFVMLGLAIAFGDLVRDGGWPALGGVVAVMGAIDAIFAPRLIRKHWRQIDAERADKANE